MIHEIFRETSRFPRYISCYISETRLPFGQCTLMPLRVPHGYIFVVPRVEPGPAVSTASGSNFNLKSSFATTKRNLDKSDRMSGIASVMPGKCCMIGYLSKLLTTLT